MKRLICLGGVLVFIITQMYAGRPIKFGAQGGVNLPFSSISQTAHSISGTPKDINHLTGFHFGPILEIEPINVLSINTGLLFNYNKTELSGIASAPQVEKDINQMFSLQVPLLIEGRYHIMKILALYAEAGPYGEIGLLGLAKQTYKTAAESESKAFSYNQFDYGLKFGLGFEVLIFKIGASYSFGLPSHTLSNGISNFEMQNRMVQLHLAIR